MTMIKHKVQIEITVPFHAYKTKAQNEKAKRYITRWIKDALDGHVSFIPLYIEKIGNVPIEDCCEKSIIKVK